MHIVLCIQFIRVHVIYITPKCLPRQCKLTTYRFYWSLWSTFPSLHVYMYHTHAHTYLHFHLKIVNWGVGCTTMRVATIQYNVMYMYSNVTIGKTLTTRGSSCPLSWVDVLSLALPEYFQHLHKSVVVTSFPMVPVYECAFVCLIICFLFGLLIRLFKVLSSHLCFIFLSLHSCLL